MADVIHLTDNGIPQYLATHVDAVEGLDESLGEYVNTSDDQTVDGKKRFEKIPTVTLSGTEQSVIAGEVEYVLSKSDIYPGSESIVKDVSGIITRTGNFCWLEGYVSVDGASALTKAIKLPSGYKRRKKGTYQHSLALTRNARQDEYAKSVVNTDDTAAVRILSGDGSNYITGGWYTEDPFPVG